MSTVRYIVEGITDRPVAIRLIQRSGLEPQVARVGGGKASINRALKEQTLRGNLLVMRDLDHDAECAPALVGELLPYGPPRGLCLRIPVRQVESWMLADIEGFASEFAVNIKAHTINPDELDNPKQYIVNLCRRSKNAQVRRDIIPLQGGSARFGPRYAKRIIRFAEKVWDPERAAGRSPSLARALAAMDRLTAEGIWR